MGTTAHGLGVRPALHITATDHRTHPDGAGGLLWSNTQNVQPATPQSKPQTGDGPVATVVRPRGVNWFQD
jgi:hypothetical protein